MALHIIQNDAEWEAMSRRCRFSVERELAANAGHLRAAAKVMHNKAIVDLGKKGYQYMDDVDPRIEGPYEHVEFSDDCTVESDPAAVPDPRNIKAFSEWERVAKARSAKKFGQQQELVDFELILHFRRKAPSSYHAGSPAGWTRR